MSKFNYLHTLGLIIFSCMIFTACSNTKKAMSKNNHLTTYAIRLKPKQDIKLELDSFVKKNNIQAGWIVTCVGSLTNYNIRFANQPKGTTASGHFEIVSLVGTLSTNGSHVHLSVADSLGNTIRGHLLEGCSVYTTAEIVIQSTSKYNFTREQDGSTPWKELQIIENTNQ